MKIEKMARTGSPYRLISLASGLVAMGVSAVYYASVRLWLETQGADPGVIRAMAGMALFIVLFCTLVSLVATRAIRSADDSIGDLHMELDLCEAENRALREKLDRLIWRGTSRAA